MVDKKTLIDWLKKDGVLILSADVEGLPGVPGETVTVIFTNSNLQHELKGANRPGQEEPQETEAQKRKREEDKKKAEEGWGE